MTQRSYLRTLVDSVNKSGPFSTDSIDTNYMGGLNFQVEWTKVTESNTTFNTGTIAVQTLTLDTLANMNDGEWLSWYEEENDGTETRWALAADKTGSSAEPTDADWVAISSANKAQVDISGATTAADVAALYELEADGLTGMGVLTDDTAADGTMTFTQIVPGVITDATAAKKDGSASPAASWANTTPGVATEVSITGDVVTVPSHGYQVGMLVTLTDTGTMPAGLANSTNYYLITPTDSTIQFATSQANATAGTAIDLTSYGSSTNVTTIVVTTTLGGTVDIQGSNDNTTFLDVLDSAGSAIEQTIGDSTASYTYNLSNCNARYYRADFTLTTGTATIVVKANAKGGAS